MQQMNTEKHPPSGNNRHRQQTAPQIVVNSIIQQIESGELEPGQKLPPQHSLAKLFAVGTSSVREAISMLEIMGYVKVSHGRGMFIQEKLPLGTSLLETIEKSLFSASIPELVALRELLECHLVRIATRQINAQAIQHLQQCLEGLRHCVEQEHTSTRKAFIDADLAFHMAIAEAASCNAAGVLIKILHIVQTTTLGLATIAQGNEYGKDALFTAHQIVEHIIAGEEVCAVRCMRNHLHLTKDAFFKLHTSLP